MLRNNNFGRFMAVAAVSTILLTTTLIFMISNIAIKPATNQYQAFAKSSQSDKNTSAETVANPTTENDGTGTGTDHVAIVGVKHARSFSPNPIDVRVGDTVTWTNDHRESHTVTSSSGFDSGIIEPGQSFNHTFEKTGTFQYYCELHPSMVGKVNVG
jgi:plastocyanin